MSLNLLSAERFLLSRFAASLGLTPDVTIFRGQLPANLVNISSVRLTDGIPFASPKTFHAAGQILARFRDRDDALAFAAGVTGMFPVYATHWWLSPKGSAGIYESTWNGSDVWSVSCNFDFYSNLPDSFA